MNVIEKYFPREHRERAEEEDTQKTDSPIKPGKFIFISFFTESLSLSFYLIIGGDDVIMRFDSMSTSAIYKKKKPLLISFFYFLFYFAENEESAIRPHSPSNWSSILPSLRSTCTVLLSCGGF